MKMFLEVRAEKGGICLPGQLLMEMFHMDKLLILHLVNQLELVSGSS